MTSSWLGILIVAIWTLGAPNLLTAHDHPETLEVEISPEGVGTVHATLLLPAERHQVRAILMDYPNWSRLFARTPTIHRITKLEDRVRVEMSLPAFFIPMTLRLVTETREGRPFQIVTQMIEGDFDRYDWAWELSPTQGGAYTLATLTLHIKPHMWAPDWALRWILKSDLEKHFEILRARVMNGD